jgi:hypothetical protein
MLIQRSFDRSGATKNDIAATVARSNPVAPTKQIPKILAMPSLRAVTSCGETVA